MCASLCAMEEGSHLLGVSLFSSYLAHPFDSHVVCRMILFHVGLGGEKKIVHVNYMNPILYILRQGENNFLSNTQLSLVPELFLSPSRATNCRGI